MFLRVSNLIIYTFPRAKSAPSMSKFHISDIAAIFFKENMYSQKITYLSQYLSYGKLFVSNSYNFDPIIPFIGIS